MSDTLPSSEIPQTENVLRLSEEKSEAPAKGLVDKLKSALHKSSPREILEASSDQAAIERAAIEKVLPEKEKKAVQALRVSAEYLWEQKAIFGLMAIYPTFELVKKFTGLELPEVPLEIMKHGTTAAVGSMTVSGGEGRFPSRILRKARGALGFSAGVAAVSHFTGLPEFVVATTDEPAILAAQKGLEKLSDKTGVTVSTVKEAAVGKLGELKRRQVFKRDSVKAPIPEPIDVNSSI